MKFFRNLKHIFVVTTLSLMMIFGLMRIFSEEFTNSMNGFFLYRTSGGVWQDYFHRHTLTPSSDIAIIAIDEKTLSEQSNNANSASSVGISKSQYAILIQKLQNAGVKGIAFDILFQDKDTPENEAVFLRELNKYNNIVLAADYIPDFCILTYNKIYNSLSNSGGVRDAFVKFPTKESCPQDIKTLYDFTKEITDSIPLGYNFRPLEDTIDVNRLSDADKLKLYCPQGSDTVFSCPGLPRSIYSKYIWGMLDVRSVYERPLYVDISNQPYSIWKLSTGTVSTPADFFMKTFPYALYDVVNTGSKIALNELPVYFKTLIETTNSRSTNAIHILQPFFGPPNSYSKTPFVDVTSQNITMKDMIATFNGKYVLIGESGTHIKDAFISPVTNTSIDGVELHAHFLDGLLQNKMLKKLDSNIGYILIVILTCTMAVLYLYTPKYISPIIAITTLCLVLYVSRYAYDVNRVVVDIFLLFLAGGIVTYPMTFIYRFFIVDREKRKLQNNFGHYIDPHVVEEIADRGEEIQLGGESRVLSVLFSDIAGFTTISESMNPRDLFYLMTSYLSNMTDILIGQGGTLDKYIGDAVMGFFGAPLSYEDHAIRAANTALLMRAQLPLFNIELEHHGIKPIDFRVGIATGEVMVGNIGSHDRFNYTVLGDTVNLASRLEGTGKEYDVHVIVSEDTERLLSPVFFTRELDTIAVKGKTKGVRIYELVGYSKDYPERTMYVTYDKALRLYRAGDYREAGKVWQTIAKMDPPSRIMMFRCLEILKGNITVEDGIYQMTHK